jgi:hypothetical protein
VYPTLRDTALALAALPVSCARLAVCLSVGAPPVGYGRAPTGNGESFFAIKALLAGITQGQGRIPESGHRV